MRGFTPGFVSPISPSYRLGHEEETDPDRLRGLCPLQRSLLQGSPLVPRALPLLLGDSLL